MVKNEVGKLYLESKFWTQIKDANHSKNSGEFFF